MGSFYWGVLYPLIAALMPLARHGLALAKSDVGLMDQIEFKRGSSEGAAILLRGSGLRPWNVKGKPKIKFSTPKSKS